VCLAGHEVSENGLETQLNTDENEKQKEKPAADQFFSSLLSNRKAYRLVLRNPSGFFLARN
jgi:hypothetical protein